VDCCYVDYDLAYLLGAIVARGEISRDNRITRIVIHYPFRNLEVEGINTVIDVSKDLPLGLDKIVSRFNNLSFDSVQKQLLDYEVQVIIEMKTESIADRVLKCHLGNAINHAEFHIPRAIFQAADVNIKLEFMRGYADVAGHVRKSNAYTNGRHRVYIDVLNPNWHLPVELCQLLQDHLEVPVQTITWGHPDIRGEENWAREHQIKVFADEYEKVGFYIEYKNKILKELANFNREKELAKKSNFCNCDLRNITQKRKVSHSDAVNDPRLPDNIRGLHFNSYREICRVMGCPRCKKWGDVTKYVQP
jgi:hypothetical protein